MDRVLKPKRLSKLCLEHLCTDLSTVGPLYYDFEKLANNSFNREAVGYVVN